MVGYDFADFGFDDAPVGLAIVAPDGRFVRVNRRLVALSGYSEERLLQLTFTQLSADPDVAPSEEARRDLLKGVRSSYQVTKAYRRPDGSTWWAEIATTLIRDAAGAPRHFLTVILDADARVRLEHERAEAEQRYRALFERSLDAVYLHDLEGRFLDANPAALAMFGYTHEELANLTIASVLADQAELERARDALGDLVATGRSHAPEEYRARRRDGETVWIELAGALVLQDGHPVAVLGVARDTTAAKRANEELLRAQQLQQLLIDSAPLAILGLDATGHVTQWSAGAERMFGWSAAEASGRFCPIVPMTERTTFLRTIRLTLTSGPQTGLIVPRVHRDGTRLQVRLSVAPLPALGGSPEGVMVILEDITRQALLEEEVLRAQRLDNIGDIAGGIAHDLNNVLTPVLATAELLAAQETDPAKREELTRIATSAKRGADMLRHLLTFARGVGGERVNVDVASLVRDLARTAEDTFFKSVRVTVDLQDAPAPVTGDPTQLHQVLLNLAVNARDAMPDGGVLALSARNAALDAEAAAAHPRLQPGRYVVITVADTGTGIAPDIMHRIFDPFFTTKPVGKGTGLGLSTSLALVKGHGGALEVTSEPGKGTRFEVWLPARVATGDDAPPEEVDAQPRGHGELILLVDDEAPILKIARRVLTGFGYRVVEAHDGAEALAVYETQMADIDAVLTDMMMPGMSGAELVRALLELNPSARIIVASGVRQDDLHGARGFLAKPYTIPALLAAVRAVLTAGA